MRRQMRLYFAAMMLMPLIVAQVVAFQFHLSQTKATPKSSARLNGRWQVKFAFSGIEKHVIFDAKAKGVGSFQLLDTGIDDKPVKDPQPAAWSQLTIDRVSFSGEVELPIGTCCRELGTVIFKGKFSSSNTISGTLIFVTSIDEEESPYKFHSVVGTFQANRVLN